METSHPIHLYLLCSLPIFRIFSQQIFPVINAAQSTALFPNHHLQYYLITQKHRITRFPFSLFFPSLHFFPCQFHRACCLLVFPMNANTLKMSSIGIELCTEHRFFHSLRKGDVVLRRHEYGRKINNLDRCKRCDILLTEQLDFRSCADDAFVWLLLLLLLMLLSVKFIQVEVGNQLILVA